MSRKLASWRGVLTPPNRAISEKLSLLPAGGAQSFGRERLEEVTGLAGGMSTRLGIRGSRLGSVSDLGKLLLPSGPPFLYFQNNGWYRLCFGLSSSDKNTCEEIT